MRHVNSHQREDADGPPIFSADTKAHKPLARPGPGLTLLAKVRQATPGQQAIQAPPLAHRAVQPLEFARDECIPKRHQIDQQPLEHGLALPTVSYTRSARKPQRHGR